jgi:hypothetical protein
MLHESTKQSTKMFNQSSKETIRKFISHVGEFEVDSVEVDSVDSPPDSAKAKKQKLSGPQLPKYKPIMSHKSFMHCYVEWTETIRNLENNHKNLWRKEFNDREAKYISRFKFVMKFIDSKIDKGELLETIINELDVMFPGGSIASAEKYLKSI